MPGPVYSLSGHKPWPFLHFRPHFDYNVTAMHDQESGYTHADTVADSSAAGAAHGTEPPVLIERVTKRFGNVYALRNVSLIISQNEVFGLLGPNGAGKSTLLRLLLGFLHPDTGTVKLFGSTSSH